MPELFQFDNIFFTVGRVGGRGTYRFAAEDILQDFSGTLVLYIDR